MIDPFARSLRISTILLILSVGLLANSALGNMVVGWGNCSYGVCDFQGWSSDIIALGAGQWQSVSLDRNGLVQASGDNVYGSGHGIGGQYVAVASGFEHNIVLAADGTVSAWGWNQFGQTSVPVGLNGVVAVAAGYSHCIALKSDGTVVSWGGFAYTVLPPSEVNNVVAIAAGNRFSVALKSDGTVVAWGATGATNPPPELVDATSIAAGDTWAMALRSNGTITAWGDGLATNVPSGLDSVVAIAAGSAHGLALRADGNVTAWGDNSYFQLGVPGALATNVAAIAAGGTHSTALAGPGAPALGVSATAMGMAFGSFVVSIPSRSGKVYALEYKDDLTDALWNALPLAAGNGAILDLQDPSPSPTQRFYRVRQW